MAVSASSPISRQAASALLVAILCWVGIYVFLAHCFVFWKWNTFELKDKKTITPIINNNNQNSGSSISQLPKVDTIPVIVEENNNNNNNNNNTINTVPVPDEVDNTETKDNNDDDDDDDENPKEEKIPKIDMNIEYENSVREVLEEYQLQQRKLQNIHEFLQRQKIELQRLQDNFPKNIPPPFDHQDPVNVQSVIDLLMTTSLSSLHDNDNDDDDDDDEQRLQAIFQKANDALDMATDNYMTVDWEQLEISLFESGNYPTKQASVFTCPEGMELGDIASETLEPEVLPLPPGLANSKTIDQRINILKGLVARRRTLENVNAVLLPNNLKALKLVVREAIRDILQQEETRIQEMQSAETNHQNDLENDDTLCVTDEMIHSMLDDGFVAIRNHGDVRATLRRSLLQIIMVNTSQQQQQDAATSIILDADLPISQPQVSKPSTMNLARNVLDTELTYKMQSWIDALVELCGGYNDQLDQFLDSLGGGGNNNNNNNQIGEYIVSNVLNKASHVELPHPDKVMEFVLHQDQQTLAKQTFTRVKEQLQQQFGGK